ncbi:MAG: hypothetical protein V4634_13955 [Pseudomonadota bacterium]
MKISPTIRILQALGFLLAGLMLSACATTGGAESPAGDAAERQLANAIQGLDQRYAAGSIQSRDAAETALQQVSANDVALQTWRTQAEQACYDRFFVNSCLIDVKLHRREFHMILQRIRIEANALQRKLHIEELDNNLKARQQQHPE